MIDKIKLMITEENLFHINYRLCFILNAPYIYIHAIIKFLSKNFKKLIKIKYKCVKIGRKISNNYSIF